MQHVWIFQLAASPSQAIQNDLVSELAAFVAVWKAHGSPVPGAVALRHDRFVVVQAEPGHASGCSIDSMTKGVNEILAKFGLQVLGPEFVHFKDVDGSIAAIDFRDAKAAILAGRLNENTVVFDSSMDNKNDLAFWEVPLSQTWLKRMLPQKEISA